MTTIYNFAKGFADILRLLGKEKENRLSLMFLVSHDILLFILSVSLFSQLVSFDLG